jgi:hypothetical protein
MEKRTTKPEYVPFIIDVLRHLRVTNRNEILEEIYKAMKHRLHPADLVVLANGEPRWRNQAHHMLDGLMEDGVVEEVEGELKLSDS